MIVLQRFTAAPSGAGLGRTRLSGATIGEGLVFWGAVGVIGVLGVVALEASQRGKLRKAGVRGCASCGRR